MVLAEMTEETFNMISMNVNPIMGMSVRASTATTLARLAQGSLTAQMNGRTNFSGSVPQ